MTQIDLNSDLGESYGPWVMGDDAAMLGLVTSANIACGGHASDPATMVQTMKLAVQNDVTIGAHPGFVDKEGFGRRVIPLSPDEVTQLVAAQVGTLKGLAPLANAKVRYVKAHGALSNWAAVHRPAADAIARAVAEAHGDCALLAVSGTELEKAGQAHGLDVYSEIFADRGYGGDGNLVQRGQDGALIHDASFASDRLLRFLETGEMPTVSGGKVALNAQSICIHGDNPSAVAMGRRIRKALESDGVKLASFLP